MTQTETTQPLTLTVTVQQAARLLGISRGSAYELARQGQLPGAIRLGGRVVVSRSALMRAIDEPARDGAA